MGSLLLAAGTQGMRYSLPNSRIMVHQPSGGASGQATDILIQVKHKRGVETLSLAFGTRWHVFQGPMLIAVPSSKFDQPLFYMNLF